MASFPRQNFGLLPVGMKGPPNTRRSSNGSAQDTILPSSAFPSRCLLHSELRTHGKDINHADLYHSPWPAPIPDIHRFKALPGNRHETRIYS